MDEKMIERRRQIATMARAYIEGKISWQLFMDEYDDEEKDGLINELFDHIEHQPKRGGYWGVNEQQWEQYLNTRENLINELEKS